MNRQISGFILHPFPSLDFSALLSSILDSLGSRPCLLSCPPVISGSITGLSLVPTFFSAVSAVRMFRPRTPLLTSLPSVRNPVSFMVVPPQFSPSAFASFRGHLAPLRWLCASCNIWVHHCLRAWLLCFFSDGPR